MKVLQVPVAPGHDPGLVSQGAPGRSGPPGGPAAALEQPRRHPRQPVQVGRGQEVGVPESGRVQ